jgi:hypothetical protein
MGLAVTKRRVAGRGGLQVTRKNGALEGLETRAARSFQSDHSFQSVNVAKMAMNPKTF